MSNPGTGTSEAKLVSTAMEMTRERQVSEGEVQAFAGPRPDMAGWRVEVPGSGKIWLIDPHGYRRWIPDVETFENLFRNWERSVDPKHAQISEGPPLTQGAVLFRGTKVAQIFLLDGSSKRWITSVQAFERCNFDWNKVRQVPQSIVDSLQNSTHWT